MFIRGKFGQYYAALFIGSDLGYETYMIICVLAKTIHIQRLYVNSVKVKVFVT